MMLFAEYLTDPGSQWRPYDPKLPANAQHKQDRERIRMDLVSGFLPEQAAELVAGLEISTEVENVDPSGQISNLSPSAPAKTSKRNQARSVFSSDEPLSSKPWSMVIGLIMAVFGLLLLLLKLRAK